MAALNEHVESVHLLLDLGASVSEVTVEDGTTIDLIGYPLFSTFQRNYLCPNALLVLLGWCLMEFVLN